MKTCRRCSIVKSLDEFYRHSRMLDGHLNICKECVKTRILAHRQENLGRIRAHDRERGQLPHRKAANANRAHRYRKHQSKFKERYPEKRRAHVIVGNAIRDGKLIPQPCERCGSITVDAHHENYTLPLDVTWLCAFHHGERHREINAELRDLADKADAERGAA